MKEDTTMKKTYIAPTIEVIRIATTQMLAGSLGSNETPYVNFDSFDEDDDGEGLYEY